MWNTFIKLYLTLIQVWAWIFAPGTYLLTSLCKNMREEKAGTCSTFIWTSVAESNNFSFFFLGLCSDPKYQSSQGKLNFHSPNDKLCFVRVFPSDVAFASLAKCRATTWALLAAFPPAFAFPPGKCSICMVQQFLAFSLVAGYLPPEVLALPIYKQEGKEGPGEDTSFQAQTHA